MAAATTEGTTRPALIEDQWNEISILSILGFGSIPSLVAKADEAENRLDTIPGSITPRFFADDEDLERILGKAGAQKARDNRPVWGAVLKPDRGKLGLSSYAIDEEVLALCERRGVPVSGDHVDRRSLERLGQLLERERRFPEGEFDAIAGNTISAAV